MRRPAQLKRRRITAPRARGRSIRRIFHSLWRIGLAPAPDTQRCAGGRASRGSVALPHRTRRPDASAYSGAPARGGGSPQAGQSRRSAGHRVRRRIARFASLRGSGLRRPISSSASGLRITRYLTRSVGTRAPRGSSPRLRAAAHPRAQELDRLGMFLWQHREIRIPARKGFVELSRSAARPRDTFRPSPRWRPGCSSQLVEAMRSAEMRASSASSSGVDSSSYFIVRQYAANSRSPAASASSMRCCRSSSRRCAASSSGSETTRRSIHVPTE